MTVLKATSAAIVAAAITFSAASAQAAPSPKGVWMNDTGRGAIEIKSCGNALCGHVVWVKATGDEKGCGKQIIGEAQPTGGGRWDNGWIYSPEKKRRYDVELTPLSETRLRVVGYAGTKFFSKTMIWTKAPDDLQRCGTKTATTVEANAAPMPEAPKAAAVEPKPATVAAKQDAAKAAVSAPVRAESAAASVPPPQPAKPALAAKPTAVPAKPDVAIVAPAAPAASNPAPADKSAGTPSAEASGTEPSGTGSSSDETASNNTASSDDDDPANAPKADGGGLNLGDLDLDKFLKRSGDGKCKLDLPWIKVNFDCEK